MTQKTGNRLLGLLLALSALASLCLFLVPAYVIRPFRHQSERALSLAIAVKSVAPILSLILGIEALVLTIWLWSRSSRGARALAVVGLLLSIGSSIMVRQNYFEWMFQPIAAAGFVPASDARLPDQETVMAVAIGPDARAYAIAEMAYHHILNDTVGTEPIVVTY